MLAAYSVRTVGSGCAMTAFLPPENEASEAVVAPENMKASSNCHTMGCSGSVLHATIARAVRADHVSDGRILSDRGAGASPLIAGSTTRHGLVGAAGSLATVNGPSVTSSPYANGSADSGTLMTHCPISRSGTSGPVTFDRSSSPGWVR
jgi:hypothetical protein